MNKDYKCLISRCSDVYWKGAQAHGRLVCPCGCNTFFLFRREKSPEEKMEEAIASNRLHDDYWPFGPVIAKDEAGKTVVRNEFLGFRWKERPFSDYQPTVMSFQYVSAKCEKCGNEIVLFDERFGPLNKYGSSLKFGNLGKIKWTETASEVEIIVDCDECDNDGLEFGRLRIYKVFGKTKRLFFDYET